MADGSVNDDLPETRLPDGRLIFDLITSNDLAGIRSVLNPLTLHERQMIVYRKIEHKTLLYRACECGFKDIAKYLLDECGADVDDGYCVSSKTASPLFVAIRKLDIFLMTLLMRRETSVGLLNYETACSDYAYRNRYNSVMSILRLYKNRVHRSNLLVSTPEAVGHNGLFMFFWISELSYDIRSGDFLAATASGQIGRMKTLLAGGVDKNYKNEHEENALCVAIMHDQKNAENFLINYKFYTLKSYSQALELCGAKFIIFRSDEEKGLQCWRKSVRVRRENSIDVTDKNLMLIETDLGIEFRTEDDIDRLQEGDIYLQALVVFLRLLSKFSRLLHNAFFIVAKHRVFEDDLLQSIKVLSEAYDLPSKPLQGVRSPTMRSVDTLITLFRGRFHKYDGDVCEYLDGLKKLFDFLDAGKWAGLLRGAVEFYKIAYGELLEIVLANIQTMKRFGLSQQEKLWVEACVGSVLQSSSYPYPTTLLHRAILSELPLDVVSFLLKCTTDVNCLDALDNTPLHVVSLLPGENANMSSLAHLLIDAGAHVDAMNKLGIRPLELLRAKGVLENPLKFISLQCLAAEAISRHKIFVNEKTLPKVLVKFIKLHSR